MAKKKFFLIVDTETTQTDKVADFGAVICDRQGKVHQSMGVLTREFYAHPRLHPLFHIYGDAGDLWSKANLPARYARYDAMVENGSRMVATVPAINRWLAKAAATYRPTLTAYNLAFDAGKCQNSDIDLSLFPERFCLWHAAAQKWGQSRPYLQFILDTVGFNPPTAKGNMSYLTNAEVMARFVTGDNLPPEPHTALEDALGYELPILKALIANEKKARYMNPVAYSWRDYQVKDKFKVR